MSASDSNMWIGGNDIATEGTWVWEDGEIWGGFTAWNQGEPNGGVFEQCIILLDYKRLGSMFLAEDCTILCVKSEVWLNFSDQV